MSMSAEDALSDASDKPQEYDWSHLYSSERSFSQSPIVLRAEIVRGFQRGSKELGIPTANLCMETLGQAGQQLDTGIYYGTASLSRSLPLPLSPSSSDSSLQEGSFDAVVSVGWNPFYKNSVKTVEAHLLAPQQPLQDFYGETMELTLLGYLRPEANFNGLDELISCINSDIRIAKERLGSISKL